MKGCQRKRFKTLRTLNEFGFLGTEDSPYIYMEAEQMTVDKVSDIQIGGNDPREERERDLDLKDLQQ